MDRRRPRDEDALMVLDAVSTRRLDLVEREELGGKYKEAQRWSRSCLRPSSLFITASQRLSRHPITKPNFKLLRINRMQLLTLASLLPLTYALSVPVQRTAYLGDFRSFGALGCSATNLGVTTVIDDDLVGKTCAGFYDAGVGSVSLTNVIEQCKSETLATLCNLFERLRLTFKCLSTRTSCVRRERRRS